MGSKCHFLVQVHISVNQNWKCRLKNNPLIYKFIFTFCQLGSFSLKVVVSLECFVFLVAILTGTGVRKK